MTDHETEIQPADSGYYLIYINREDYPKAREALKSAGVPLEYRHYTELGYNTETHCSIASVEGVIADTLNGLLEEHGLQIKSSMTWEEMRIAAEFFANSERWTGNHETDEEAFRNRFPYLVEPA